MHKDPALKSISFLIPCFNEEEAIGPLRKRLIPVINRLKNDYSVQMVLVDDGSTDDTYFRLIRIFAGLPFAKTVILRHMKNRGIGAAMRTGFEAVTGDIVCTLDSDCTYAPEKMPEMIDLLIRAKADIVTGSPYHPLGKVVNVTPNRLFLSKAASRMYSFIVPTKLYCYTSFFRVYRREWVRSDFFTSDGFLAVTEVLLSAANQGAKIVEFPICLGARVVGRSKMRVAKTTMDHLKLMSKTALFNTILSGAQGRMVKDQPGGIPSLVSTKNPDLLLHQWALVGRTDYKSPPESSVKV